MFQAISAFKRPISVSERLLICVVDDDRRLGLSLEDLLLGTGFEVMLASSAEEFLESPESDHCDCVVCDVRMPGIGGLELLRQIRSRRDVPVLMISAHGTQAVREQVDMWGGAGFIEKPFDAGSLIDQIRRAVRPAASDT